MRLINESSARWLFSDAVKLYLVPENIAIGNLCHLPLAGGPMGFDGVRLFMRDNKGTRTLIGSIDELMIWAKQHSRLGDIEEKLDLICRHRSPFEGVTLDKPRLIGVVNVTPDSFSDGGCYLNHDAAISHGESLIRAGADIIDVGGESTRPGAESISEATESIRILPVIKRLGEKYLVSVDTRNATVMKKAIRAGARIINDVSALTADPNSLNVVATNKCPVILMHSKGEPRTMQNNPTYRDALLDIFDYLSERIRVCEKMGVIRNKVIIDPGIGFGQNDIHIKSIMKHIGLFHGLGCPILAGFSRKGFIGRWSEGEVAADRLPGSIASVLWAVSKAVQVFRVHDVAATRQALAVWSHVSQ